MLNKLMISAIVALFLSAGQGLAAGQSEAVPSAHVAGDAVQLAQDASAFPIKPSEAALIAKNANPDGKVLSVKLLPSGQYAVTLKIGGNVVKVLVDATSGDLG